MKLSLKNLRLRQGSFWLEIDAEVNGRVIGVFGPSGAGKTSLLEIVAGLRQPTSGAVEIDGETTWNPGQKRCRVGYVPQDLALFPHLSVQKNIVYGHDAEAAAPGINVDHVAEVLEITPLLARAPAQLSGGQKQRVAFARALLASPRVLLMDEPLASLDQELKLKIVPYLMRIRDEFQIPLIYVSHSADELAVLCDQVMVMHEGRCLRISPPGEIFEPATAMALKPGILSDPGSKAAL